MIKKIVKIGAFDIPPLPMDATVKVVRMFPIDISTDMPVKDVRYKVTEEMDRLKRDHISGIFMSRSKMD